MAMHTASATRRIVGFLLKAVLILAVLLIILVAGAYFYITSDAFGERAGKVASGKSGRVISLERVEIRGPVSEPRIILHQPKVGNPEWAKDPSMFEAERIEFTVRLSELLRLRLNLPELVLEKPKMALERQSAERKNWDFATNPASQALEAPAPENRFEFPVIGQMRINSGIMHYIDTPKKLDVTMDISTAQGEADKQENIVIKSEGTYQGQKFLMNATGASVMELRESKAPYPFSFKADVGQTHASAEGTVEDPVKLEGLDVTLDLKGASTADVYELTGILLPESPPYRIAGHLNKRGKIWTFNDFSGRLGSSDISGDIAWDAEKKPPFLKGKLVSRNLDLKDLAGFIGADEQPEDESRVIPDRRLKLDKLSTMDADVEFKGERVKTTNLLDNMVMKVKLDNKVLRFQPLSFDMADGKIKADIAVDARKEPPLTDVDVHFSRLSLEKLFAPLAKRFGEENVTAGTIGGRAQLKGHGASLRDILGGAEGTIGIGMEGGRLSRLLLELAGIDLFRAAGLVLDGDKPVAINCVVGDFDVNAGVMQTKTFLIDTDVTTSNGSGTVSLKDEALDMRFTVHPKDTSLFAARTPILVGGRLKKPSVGLDPAALAARGAAAAALGVLLTPIGALLAFLEPGLGEDSQCAKFVKEVDQKTGGTVPK